MDVEASEDAKQNDVKAEQKTCCVKFNEWFWKDDSDKLNPEKRKLCSYKALMITRLVFLVVLVINHIWAVVYTIIDDDFLLFHLYFTTWSYYFTIYIMLWLVFTSKYFKNNEFSENNKWHVRLLRHNNLAFFIILCSQVLVTLIYWGALFRIREGGRTFTSALNHILPFAALLVDFILVGYVFRWTYGLALLAYVLIYMPINGIYAAIADDPLYRIMTWKSIWTFIWIMICVLILGSAYLVFIKISVCRYKKHIKKRKMQVMTSGIDQTKDLHLQGNIYADPLPKVGQEVHSRASDRYLNKPEGPNE